MCMYYVCSVYVHVHYYKCVMFLTPLSLPPSLPPSLLIITLSEKAPMVDAKEIVTDHASSVFFVFYASFTAMEHTIHERGTCVCVHVRICMYMEYNQCVH